MPDMLQLHTENNPRNTERTQDRARLQVGLATPPRFQTTPVGRYGSTEEPLSPSLAHRLKTCIGYGIGLQALAISIPWP